MNKKAKVIKRSDCDHQAKISDIINKAVANDLYQSPDQQKAICRQSISEPIICEKAKHFHQDMELTI